MVVKLLYRKNWWNTIPNLSNSTLTNRENTSMIGELIHIRRGCIWVGVGASSPIAICGRGVELMEMTGCAKGMFLSQGADRRI
jgi:hypothetical protein